jgi:bifunctional enzyme CysN/CysC/sulfate adenylyltransferase subunit 1
MHEDQLVPGRTYLAKHTSRMVRARALSIHYKVDVNTLQHLPSKRLAMNDIASVRFETTTPLLFDPYRTNRATGSLVLIDPITNATVGAVMITQDAAHQHASDEGFPHSTIAPALVLLPNRQQLADALLQTLNQAGHRAIALDDIYIPASGLVAAVRATQLAGAVAVITNADLPVDFAAQVQTFLPQERYFQSNTLPADDTAALQALLSTLDPHNDSPETGANA